MQDIRLFNDAIVCNSTLLIIDIALISHLFMSMYISFKKNGRRFDLWHLNLIYLFLFNLLLVYPFNSSPYNEISTSNNQNGIISSMDDAFFVLVLGYIFIWIGRFIYDSLRYHSIFGVILSIAKPYEKVFAFNLKSRIFCIVTLLVGSIITIYLFYIQMREGYLFNPRAFYLKNGSGRGIYNLALSIFNFLSIYLAIRVVGLKKKTDLVLFILTIFCTFFLGTRVAVMTGIIYLIIFHLCLNPVKLSLSKILKYVFVAFLVIFLVFYVGNVREGHYNPLDTLSSIGISLAYGNTFSDTRDFAWILSKWDGNLLGGNTILAAFLGFIPRSFSDYRELWSLSIVTNGIVGFDSTTHAGLRPGAFGESYLNFGFFGPPLFGLVYGYYLRHVDASIKNSGLIAGYSKALPYKAVLALMPSSGFWMIYVEILFNLTIYSVLRNLFPAKPAPTPKTLKRLGSSERPQESDPLGLRGKANQSL